MSIIKHAPTLTIIWVLKPAALFLISLSIPIMAPKKAAKNILTATKNISILSPPYNISCYLKT